MAARIRHLVEQAGFFEHDWLVARGSGPLDRFTAMFGFYGVAEAVELLGRGAARRTPPRRAGHGAGAPHSWRGCAGFVAATPMPYCEATGGHALLHAQSGIDTDFGVTAGARIPVGSEPPLYEHIRAVAPNHRHVPGGDQ